VSILQYQKPVPCDMETTNLLCLYISINKFCLILLNSFNNLISRRTWVRRHYKSRTILVKPIWIYWTKR